MTEHRFMADVGKILLVSGALLIIIGIAVTLAGKIPGIGKLPGDIIIKREHVTFYIPLTTSIIISVILSLVLLLWHKR